MFRNRNTDEVLNQIYDFIKERPNFSKKTQFEKIVDFFREIHEDSDTTFKFETPHRIIGNFGLPLIVSIHDAPDYNDKSRFIDWVLARI
ncbi:hypothetical protein [Acinetobacter ihumii]|uniref:hypothetical protein n=1 Tax=Acinetobacter ihumii TaxID=2483802 RepID=UPI001030A4F4|nr:hypothetical protein [Acinetobacter ihumii]